jgi:hypothetical protein
MTGSVAPRPPLPYGKTFLVGLLAVNAAAAACGALMFLGGWGFGIAAAILLGLALSVLAFKFRRIALLLAAIYAATGAILTSMSVRNYVTVRAAGTAEGVALAEVPARAAAGAFTFADGAVRADLRGQHYAVSSGSRGRHRSSRWSYVAPVVPEDWTAELPVTVWAACGEIASCRESWDKPFRAGLRLNPETRSLKDFELAVRDAESRHGLRSHPGAIFITWVESPRAAIRGFLSEAKFAVVFWNFALFVLFLLWSVMYYFL